MAQERCTVHRITVDKGLLEQTRAETLADGQRRFWMVLGSLLVLAGAFGSVFAANAIGRSGAEKSQKAFASASVQIAATLKLALQHEEDLVISAHTLLLDNPHISQSLFTEWATSERAFARYPELLNVGDLLFVPSSQLPAYAAHALATTVNGVAPPKTFAVVPPGNRPYYCLSGVGLARDPSSGATSGLDFCAGASGHELLSTRDSGASALQPVNLGTITYLSLGIPIYRGGFTPATVALRRSAFLGWVGMSVVPNVILTQALAGQANTAVAMTYGSGASLVTFRSGSAPTGSKGATFNLHNGWTVRTTGSVATGGIFASAGALTMLLGGLALSLLLGATIYVLGTSRARAVELVGKRTNQLQFQALHDPLTSLPNRALILDRVEQMLTRARRTHQPTAAIYLDIDDFKDINDTLGHSAGDELLIAVGDRLAATLREGDTVGRLGGDEFVMLIEGISLSAGVEVVADRILDVLQAPFEIPSSALPLSVSASLGIATGDRLTPDLLLRDADIALYRAKAAGKHCAVVFSSAMQVEAQNHRHLEVDLHKALSANQFFLLYQPTIDLQSNEFTGVEALLRWRHPERGVVLPDEFIPALEASGLIVPVGAWVLQEACRQGAAWSRKGHPFTVSVNVSARQLERDRILDDVQNALSESGFNPEQLVLELTETTLMNEADATILRLKLLKALGVRIAIDDFGTGYSSLSYLRRFPIDILKIDRCFVSGIGNSAQASALVHTLVQLGKVLNLETVAEGIEDDDQRLRLQAESVDTGQGFLFAKPLDVNALDKFLDRYQVKARQLPQNNQPLAAGSTPR